MEDLMTIATYIFNRYEDEYKTRIDEMKLHKLMYFAQRESYIQTNEPLFDAVFYGWKYGPVLKEIRKAYAENAFVGSVDPDVISRIKPIMDKVFEEYAGKDSWSLSRLTHGELSWKNSRIGILDGDWGDVPLKQEDIINDAERIKSRREALAQLGIS